MLALNDLVPDKMKRRRSKGRSMIMSCFAIDDRDWWCQSVLFFLPYSIYKQQMLEYIP